MVCPHCRYEHGWNGDKLDDVKGAKGNFFRFSHYLIEKLDTWPEIIKFIYGCTSCNKLFMD